MTLFLAAGEAIPAFLPQMVAMIVAAALLAYLGKRVGVTPIVAFLLAGVVVGPHALGLVRDEETVGVLAEVGVVLLLFSIGVEFSLERLAAIKGLIFGLGGLQVGLTVALTAGALLPFGVGWRDALFTGCLVSLSSTAVVLKLLGSRGEANTRRGQSALAVLIFQDLAVVAMVLLVPMLGTGGGGLGSLFWALAKAVLLVVLVLVVARRVMPKVLEIVARTCVHEVFLLTVVAICFGTAYLSGLFGVSLALGAFLAGLVVSESKFGHHAFAEILPLQVLFSAVFFVSVGMLLDVRFVLGNPLLVAGLTAGLFALKAVAATAAASAVPQGQRRLGVSAAAAVGLLLAQVGEFAFVLQRVGAGAGLNFAGAADGGEQPFVASSVVLLLLTPLMVWTAARLARKPGDAAAPRPAAHGTLDGLSGHVLVDGFGPFGQALAKRLRANDVPVGVVTLNPGYADTAEAMGLGVVREATTSPRGLLDAGLMRARLVVALDDDEEASRRVIGVSKGLHQTLPVWVAAEDVDAAAALRAAGADEVLLAGELAADAVSRRATALVGADAAV